jgi:hypothetical protein
MRGAPRPSGVTSQHMRLPWENGDEPGGQAAALAAGRRLMFS